MSTSRILLLSPIEEEVRPDTDLTVVVEDLMASLRTLSSTTVVHAEVATLADIERAVRLHRPDAVFNACETLDGQSENEPLVPLLLDRMGVPFTGSTARCLRLCLRKAESSAVLRNAGVPIPATYKIDAARPRGIVPASAYPVIVKPEREDGSVGIDENSVVHDEDALVRVVGALADRGQPAIAQSYVEGREIAVALLGWPEPRVLPPGEILYDAGVFDGRARILTYASKWDEASVEYGATKSVGAELSPALLAKLGTHARRAAKALGMRDYGRVDFRVDAQGNPFVIDVNPNCDLSADGGFMRAAARAGLGHEDAVRKIVAGAKSRMVTPELDVAIAAG